MSLIEIYITVWSSILDRIFVIADGAFLVILDVRLLMLRVTFFLDALELPSRLAVTPRGFILPLVCPYFDWGILRRISSSHFSFNLGHNGVTAELSQPLFPFMSFDSSTSFTLLLAVKD